MKTSKNTIVAFNIGRGGIFNNAGCKSFIGEKNIGAFVGNLFLCHENLHSILRDNEYNSDERSEIMGLIEKENFDLLYDLFEISEKDLGEIVYFELGGMPVGLSAEECETGIGCINIDKDYDSTYTSYLFDCSQEELSIIERSTSYKSEELTEEVGRLLSEYVN